MTRPHYPRIIPLFPLPNLVFFPNTYLPLHIFEPRYREMIQDTKKEEQIIGMVLLKEGWENNYYGRPEICSEGCAGQLMTAQPLDEGRFNIVLKGLFRFSVKDQFFDKNYREALVEPFAQDNTKGSLPQQVKDDLKGVLKKWMNQNRGPAETLSLLKKELDDETLIHTLSYTLPFSTLDKQFLLESETLTQQAKRLMELIHFKALQTNPTSAAEPE
ncbi:MAG: LON peptidase substrate-binding domain-containing protein [Nitrospirae bacterium]|nr:LON peptidase substrate-binding domain-containing protein [Nitrospirota bacterium]